MGARLRYRSEGSLETNHSHTLTSSIPDLELNGNIIYVHCLRKESSYIHYNSNELQTADSRLLEREKLISHKADNEA